LEHCPSKVIYPVDNVDAIIMVALNNKLHPGHYDHVFNDAYELFLIILLYFDIRQKC
jgi:hypothetical protein